MPARSPSAWAKVTSIPLMSPFPIEKDQLCLGMLGLSPGNGHPFSWSAMFNGYDREKMAHDCPYPTIPDYLNKQPEDTLTIAGAKVTHICCTGEGEFTADQVAACSFVPHVVASPEAMIGKVDAVIVAADIGSEHVTRCRPFVEAGVPLFVDKPMVDHEADLAVFDEWVSQGHPIVSGSSLRYAKELLPYRLSTHNLGPLRVVTMTMIKKWETYGIHALEAIYPILGPGFLTCRNTGTPERNVVHLTHRCGADVVIFVHKELGAGSGLMTLLGGDGYDVIQVKDSFYAFKAQLEDFVAYLRTGIRPFPYEETRELMKIVIAGIRSREAGGEELSLCM